MDDKKNNSTIDDFDQQELLWAWSGRISTEMLGEVKEPLSALLAQLKLMERRIETGENVNPESLTPMLEQVDRMNDLVDGFLDLSGGCPLFLQPIDIIELCDSTARILAALFICYDAAWEQDPPPEQEPSAAPYRPLWLCTDAAKVRQILLNLLCNALEAGADHISIQITQQGRAVIIEVADNGPGLQGISDEEAFEAGLSTKPNSPGLGLPLSRRLAGRLGGDLTLIPTEQGCRMRLILADMEEVNTNI